MTQPIKMTYSEYDDLCEKLRTVKNENPLWIPAEEEIQAYSGLPYFLFFLLWVCETAECPNPDLKEKKKYLQSFLYSHFLLNDDPLT